MRGTARLGRKTKELIPRLLPGEIALTLKEPFQISSGTQSRRRIVLVELRDADGVEAWGECAAGELPSYSYETADTAWIALRDWVVPRVLGKSFDGPEAVHPVLELAPEEREGHHGRRQNDK